MRYLPCIKKYFQNLKGPLRNLRPLYTNLYKIDKYELQWKKGSKIHNRGKLCM